MLPGSSSPSTCLSSATVSSPRASIARTASSSFVTPLNQNGTKEKKIELRAPQDGVKTREYGTTGRPPAAASHTHSLGTSDVLARPVCRIRVSKTTAVPAVTSTGVGFAGGTPLGRDSAPGEGRCKGGPLLPTLSYPALCSFSSPGMGRGRGHRSRRGRGECPARQRRRHGQRWARQRGTAGP